MSKGPSWPWSHGSWIYNYICNQCLSPLMLWVLISIRVRCRALCEKVCQWLAIGRWFSRCPPVSPINKTDRHDIAEILSKEVLKTIKPAKYVKLYHYSFFSIRKFLIFYIKSTYFLFLNVTYKCIPVVCRGCACLSYVIVYVKRCPTHTVLCFSSSNQHKTWWFQYSTNIHL